VKRWIAAFAAIALCAATPARHAALPRGFVYLSDVAPSIVQDIRYAGAHNIVGRALPGYLAPACVLTERAAFALAKAQEELTAAGLTLRVYDCYQPQRAGNALLVWSKKPSDQQMKAEYYPRVAKSQLFSQGYLSVSSPGARGSGIAVTVERIGMPSPTPWVAGLHSCIAPFVERYHDGSIDMGTNFGCMDPLSRASEALGAIADSHRAMLADLLEKYGFKRYGNLWWSFVLADEPFPKTRFDFPITAK
jgi:zinc D-Ala-D-Ala dipeptidase